MNIVTGPNTFRGMSHCFHAVSVLVFFKHLRNLAKWSTAIIRYGEWLADISSPAPLGGTKSGRCAGQDVQADLSTATTTAPKREKKKKERKKRKKKEKQKEKK